MKTSANNIIRTAILACLLLTAARGPAQDDRIIRDLSSGNLAVAPKAQSQVDMGRLQKLTTETGKTAKIIIIGESAVPARFIRSGRVDRASYAKGVYDILTPKPDLVVVMTNKGIGAYSPALKRKDIDEVNRQTLPAFNGKRYTEGLVQYVHGLSDRMVEAKQTKSAVWAFVILVPVGIVVVIIIATAARKKSLVARHQQMAAQERQRVIQGISYLDGYTGVLIGAEADQLLKVRQQAAAKMDEAERRSQLATADGHSQARAILQDAMLDVQAGKDLINKATGGTDVALLPGAGAELEGDQGVFQPVENTCFFCSKPCQPSELTPVTMTIGGNRRTVMACPEDFKAAQSGQPNMRTMNVNGQSVPWYQVQGYDPYTMYGSSNFVWDMLAISALSSMFSPHHWWYGPHYGYGWGYGGHSQWGDTSSWSTPDYVGGAPDFGPDLGSGDFANLDFGGSDSSGDFGGVDFGGGDSGGFDFGGGDMGGGDFGGGDFGGGGDW